ncbi:MAG: PhnD/SsuA/transferrin family substrate-binding protein [Phycisphaerae bacterium]|nr:PhnD/SsuA/transferrin family substrate-binding protein [Phycisphaerae bacterium]
MLRYGFKTYEDFRTTRFAATNEQVIASVRNGSFDVGIIRSDVFEKMISSGAVQPDEFHVFHKEEKDHASLPFIHSTNAYPERAFAMLNHTDAALAETVMSSLIMMKDQDVAAKSAQCAGWTIPHNYQDLRDCLKVLKVSPYEDYGRITVARIISQYKSWIISIFGFGIIIFSGLIYIFRLNNKLILAKEVIVEREIVEISDRTQKLIGQTLHDTIGQNLTGIRLLAEAYKEKLKNCGLDHSDSINLISDLASKTIVQARDLSKELHPIELSNGSLFDVVEKYLLNIKKTFGIKFRIEWPDKAGINDAVLSMHLYRIIQESIHNAIKHGKSRNIFVKLVDHDNVLTLSVQDDGVGFCPDQTDHNGMGLHIMKYRARVLKGDLVIRNTSGKKGVTVECSVPHRTEEMKNSS